MTVPLWAVAVLAGVTASAGSLGGIGGAVLLVPALVLLGVSPLEAAPLGLLAVAAASLAAAPDQLEAGIVHQRLGVVTETTSTGGALLGAWLAALLPAPALVRVLGGVALLAGVAGLSHRGVRDSAEAAFVAEQAGEWPGTLGGQYRQASLTVPYHAKRLPLGLGATGVAGLFAGLVGVGGGFVKTPAMREVMGVPIKVAAATSLFTVGITAAAGLAVFAAQGRIDVHAGAAVVVGALVGGRVGGLVQTRLSPRSTGVAVSVLLLVVAAVLLVRG